jgi:hypothetical protein
MERMNMYEDFDPMIDLLELSVDILTYGPS